MLVALSNRFRWLVRLLPALAACQTTPDVGHTGRAVVYRLYQARNQLPTGQIPVELEAYSTAIHDMRLINASCSEPDASAYAGRRNWQRLVLLPKRAIAMDGELIRIRRQSNGAALPEQVFDYASKVVDAPDNAFLHYQYQPGGKVYRSPLCRFGSDGLPELLEVGSFVPGWQLDFSIAERTRSSQFSDTELAAGQVGGASCALRDVFGDVYYTPSWLFRAPPGMQLQVGDVVELRFGDADGGDGGQVSLVLRKLGNKQDFSAGKHGIFYCH